jgi:single-strand DNA-binding protein
MATNRQWTTDAGEKKEDAEFHRIVCWQKLAELCAQLLSKGRKVFVEGRLQTRRWTGQDGNERQTTEIVISDMIILDSRGARPAVSTGDFDIPEADINAMDTRLSGKSAKRRAKTIPTKKTKKASKKTTKKATTKKTSKADDKKKKEEEGDIPF